jgi:hypothetical protein
MEEHDVSDIQLAILKSKILDWDPRGSRVVGTLGCTPANTLEDGWNTDDDLGGLSVAIDNCKIVDSSKDHVETNKRRRGRPKKRVVQRRGYICLTPIHGHNTGFQVASRNQAWRLLWRTHQLIRSRTGVESVPFVLRQVQCLIPYQHKRMWCTVSLPMNQ